MSIFSPVIIAESVASIGRMTMQARVRFADEIYRQQPTLLASVLIQHRMGATHPQVEVLIEILQVICEAMRLSGRQWPAITERIQEDCLQRLTARIRFAEGLSLETLSECVRHHVDKHPEKALLAFVHGRMRESGLLAVRTEVEKHLLLAALNLVEMIASTSSVNRSAC